MVPGVSQQNDMWEQLAAIPRPKELNSFGARMSCNQNSRFGACPNAFLYFDWFLNRLAAICLVLFIVTKSVISEGNKYMQYSEGISIC